MARIIRSGAMALALALSGVHCAQAVEPIPMMKPRRFGIKQGKGQRKANKANRWR